MYTLILTPSQLSIARDWCIECWPNDEDEILEASAEVIERNIAKHWAGGIADFTECNPEPPLH